MSFREVGESNERSLRLSWSWATQPFLLVKIFVLVIVFDYTLCKPATKILRPPIYDNVINYLTNYGYLPQSDIETGNLRTEDQLKDAVRALQKFGNIPVTGEMDARTKELLIRPRCGLPDDSPSFEKKRRKRYVLQGQKWSHTNLTWSLRSKSIQNLDPSRVRSALHRALSVWSKNSKLSFTEINSDDADILVFFERGYHNDGFPFDGRGQVLAHAFFPGAGRGGDAHFDEDEIWTADMQKEVDGSTNLFAVAAHEFGHSLGLAHSSVAGSLMFPWYQGLKANFLLPEDDRDAIQRLYGSRISTDVVYRPQIPTRTLPSIYTTYHHQTPTPRFPIAESPPPPPPPPPKSIPSSTLPPKYSGRPFTNPTDVDRVPNTCETPYDSVSMIRRELFIFKDRYVWRIGEAGLHNGYPTRITRLWNQLPSNLTHVDAVYERFDNKIMFFLGRQVFMFNGNVLVHGYPKPLTYLGLPPELTHVDAAMVWGYNSKTYLFSGAAYWRLDEEIGRVELDYPRDIKNVWKGIDYNIDAAFQWRDGATYFFKGYGFWKFNDRKMRVTNAFQTLSAPVWMGCPKSLENPAFRADYSNLDVVDVIDISQDRDKSEYSQAWLLVGMTAAVLIGVILIIATAVIHSRRKTLYAYSRAKILSM